MIWSSAGRENAAGLLVLLRIRGIRIWSDDGRLRYQAPKGLLTQNDVEELRAAKVDLIELLQQASSDDVVGQQITTRLPSDPVPLTFSQQLWWNCLQLGRRPSMRSVAGALHLTGPLSVKCLRECFSELVRRHESLRTRIVAADGVPWQVVDEPTEYRLETSDIGRSSHEEQAVQIRELVERMVHEPFSVATGPLFAASLIKLGDEEHVLVVAMDHMISDAASLGIVWHEILAMYAQSIRGLPCSLPQKPIQFADYALWQQRANQFWEKQHGAYWKKRLAGAARARPLQSDAMPRTGRVAWRRQPVRFTENLSEGLRTLCREKKTSIAMITFAAYTAFLLRRCAVTDLAIVFITLGRPHPKLESTIGYFGTSLFLRVEIPAGENFLDFIDRVTDEYSRAYQHSDCGRVAAEMPTPEFAWNPRFNWIPDELTVGVGGDSDGLDLSARLKIQPYELEVLPRDDIEWDGELEMVACEVKNGVSGFLAYRADRFAAPSIERFVRSFESFTEQLVRRPRSSLP